MGPDDENRFNPDPRLAQLAEIIGYDPNETGIVVNAQQFLHDVDNKAHKVDFILNPGFEHSHIFGDDDTIRLRLLPRMIEIPERREKVFGVVVTTADMLTHQEQVVELNSIGDKLKEVFDVPVKVMVRNSPTNKNK